MRSRAKPVAVPGQPPDEAFEFRVAVGRDESGQYVALLPDLPGVAGQGDTSDEAVCDAIEGFRAAAGVYRQDSVGIPWLDSELGEAPPADVQAEPWHRQWTETGVTEISVRWVTAHA